jgi:hypothetical protein
MHYLRLGAKLSLESLTWELMQFRLPHAGLGIPCFKLSESEYRYLCVISSGFVGKGLRVTRKSL